MFQEKLKDLRKKKGVTQAELAKEIFVSRSLIAKYETGVAFPNRETRDKGKSSSLCFCDRERPSRACFQCHPLCVCAI